MTEIASPARSSASTRTFSALSFSFSPDASRPAWLTARSSASRDAYKRIREGLDTHIKVMFV